MIAVTTDLRRDRRGRRIARAICVLVRESGAAEGGTSQAIHGRNDLRLRSC